MIRVPALVPATLVLLAAGPAAAVDLGDGIVHLRAGAYAAREGPPGPEAKVHPDAPAAWVAVFEGPADDALRHAIGSAGGRLVGFVPSNAYLVWADPAQAREIAEKPGFRRIDAFRDEWKIDPDLDRERLRAAADPRLFVEVWEAASPHLAAELVRDAGADVLRVDDEPGIRRLLVRAGPDALPSIAAVREVQWIEEIPRPVLRNDVVRWIIQSNDGVTLATPLHDRGLFGRDEIIGHIDEPPYLPSCYFLDPGDNTPGPLHRKIVALRRVTGPTAGSHGTHTAGTAAGENWDLAFPQHRGMAPKARLSCASFYDLNGEYNGRPSNLGTFLAAAHADGARIHTNSYGDDNRTSYTSWCVDIDAFSRQNEDDLVVFSATNLATLRTPENAKNCLAVGATYSAPDQGLRWSGGTGPTADGRRKPEVYAPGRSTRSAAVGECSSTMSSGTSMAAPAIAGGAALVREYFLRGFHPTGTPWPANGFTPTGALLKAVVVNSTVDMTGEPGYPSNAEGWGRILLDDALHFAGDARRLWLRDVRHADGLSTGEVDTWRFTVTSGAEPLKVTMTFMDRQAALNAALAPVNDLDLEVQGPAGLYRGNVVDALAGWSTTGGSPDALNGVERVLVQTPATGHWTVRVRGASVPFGPQGYAVVVNGVLAARDQRSAVAPEAGPPSASRSRPGPAAAKLVIDTVTPNPFRSATTISFALAERAPVTVRVHDVRGRLVRELLARPVDAGEHRVAWDGRDAAGEPVRSGIYFVRLVAPGVERVVKTALLR